MTSHELARKLLEEPDMQVLTYDSDGDPWDMVTTWQTFATPWKSGWWILRKEGVEKAFPVLIIS